MSLWSQANRAFYASKVWASVEYGGRRLLKYPTDLYVYEEIIARTKPEVIVETGSFEGGSAAWFSRFAPVISVDTRRPVNPTEGVEFMEGDSVALAPFIAEAVRGRTALVSLDSDHHAGHVLDELEAYAPIATEYLVVEDTAVDAYRLEPEGYPDGGPGVAVKGWLKDHPEWTPDPACERFLLGMNPGGWLRRS